MNPMGWWNKVGVQISVGSLYSHLPMFKAIYRAYNLICQFFNVIYRAYNPFILIFPKVPQSSRYGNP